ncbi:MULTISPECIES: hypothetical protein [unclassified Sinorhizobium]|nr:MULTISPECIES: hypothetical protein [unclassified Sinorhizobium]MDK1377836.1 hypothetical protein [Sinorhizobium sp. 6-70]MDK1479889.1 hypothetical protein [Sinorhizobium sp. 6-117]
MTGLEVSHVGDRYEQRKPLDEVTSQTVDVENRHFPLYCRQRYLR